MYALKELDVLVLEGVIKELTEKLIVEEADKEEENALLIVMTYSLLSVVKAQVSEVGIFVIPIHVGLVDTAEISVGKTS